MEVLMYYNIKCILIEKFIYFDILHNYLIIKFLCKWKHMKKGEKSIKEDMAN